MTVEVEQVENRYRTALGQALPGARRTASSAQDPFVRARRALERGAWQSSVADAFAQAREAQSGTAGRAAQDCVTALESRHQQEPRTVEPGDRRARWW